MNREIIFRGKRTDNGRWVAGSLWLYGESAKIFDCLDFPDGPDWYEVDPDTVGQFVGLCDRNGVKIFEGDIVTFPWYGKANLVVTYCADVKSGLGMNAGWYLQRDNFESYIEVELENSDEYIVKGNIHDHPDLLQG